MALRYLLDTNICIYIRRQRPPAVLARFQAQAAGTIVMSVVTYGELAYGVAKSSQPQAAQAALDALTAVIAVRPLPEGSGPIYGRTRALLERAGCMIGNNDLWIAAHALADDLTIVTHDTGEFRRVPGLHLEDWT